jgi:hypothetical protein
MRENTFGGGGLHASLERRIVQKSSKLLCAEQLSGRP